MVHRQAVEGRLHERLQVVRAQDRVAGRVLLLRRGQRLSDRERPVEVARELGHDLGRVSDRVGVGVAVAGVGHPERTRVCEGLRPVVDRSADAARRDLCIVDVESRVTPHREEEPSRVRGRIRRGPDVGGGEEVVLRAVGVVVRRQSAGIVEVRVHAVDDRLGAGRQRLIEIALGPVLVDER